jgi:hypothetical protein
MELVVGLSVVVSLVVLIAEVRTNTRAIERQSRMEYASSMTQPYMDGVSMGDVLAKVKAVDGREPTVAALMDAYGLTDVEAAAWNRFLFRAWQGMDADFRYGGRELVEETLRRMLPYPDAEIYWETARGWHSPEFQALVDEIRAESSNAQ